MIEIPSSFEVPVSGGTVTVIYKGCFDPHYDDKNLGLFDKKSIVMLGEHSMFVENFSSSYRIGFSNFPLVEPFPGFATDLIRKIVENESSKNIKMSLESCTDATIDIIDKTVYSLLFHRQFLTIQGEFFHSLACLPLARIAEKSYEHVDCRSETKRGSDCMRYICLGEAIDDIIEESSTVVGTIINITSFDEVPYSVPGMFLNQRLIEQATVELTKVLDGKIPEDSIEFEGMIRKIYVRAKDHYLQATRARVEVQVFVPK